MAFGDREMTTRVGTDPAFGGLLEPTADPTMRRGMTQDAGVVRPGTVRKAAPVQPTISASPFAAQQNTLAEMLFRQAQGQGPSLAEEQARQKLAQQEAAQASMAASAPAAMRGLALRNAAEGVGQANQGFAQQVMMGRLAEQEQARNALGQLLQGARGQDLEQALALYRGGLEERMQGRDLATQKWLALQQIEANKPKEPSMWDRLAGIGSSVLPLAGTLAGGPIGGAIAKRITG